jgi:exodeoxyribonuclease-3
LGKKA